MPEIVLRHKDKGVGAYLLSVPEGVDEQEWIDAIGPGWSVDKKTDPADLPDPQRIVPNEQPAAPVENQE